MIILTASNKNNNKHPPLPTHYLYIHVYMCIPKIYLQNICGLCTELNKQYVTVRITGMHTHARPLGDVSLSEGCFCVDYHG